MMLGEVVFADGVLLGRVRGFVLWSGVHAAKMLGEEVFAVEVVVVQSVVVVWVYCRWTQVTAPEAELDVLRTDVSLPLVLGTEVGLTAIGSERAGKRAAIFCLGVRFHGVVRGFRGPTGFPLGSSG